MTQAVDYAVELMKTLFRDRPRLDMIDDYHEGRHADPYIPDSAGAEYRLLVGRAVCNMQPLLVDTSAQSLYVDTIRPGRKVAEGAVIPEWEHWQVSRLDARQAAIYRAALIFGHSFAVTEKRRGVVQTKGLSPRETAAIYEDPGNDETPRAALHIEQWPDAENDLLGEARLWDDEYVYDVYFETFGDYSNMVVDEQNRQRHGASACPVTRFAVQVDLEGRTKGVVEPMIQLQDRINQSIFDMLVVQTFGAFKVRTITGMAPPHKMRYEENADGEMELVPDLDEQGNIQVTDVQVSAMRYMFAADADVKFGSLPETPLDGYIRAIGMAIQHLAAISQTPPHYLLGQLVNIGADALQAAETALSRKNEELRKQFGESWERVFRLAAELNGIPGAVDDYKVEAGWRDLEARSMAKTADALLKLMQMGIPSEGLWPLVPGVTTTQLEQWKVLKKSDPQSQMADAIQRNAGARAGNIKTKDDPDTPAPTRQPDEVP